jgi:hypothetical protein
MAGDVAAQCPRCRRPVAAARATCLYCGAPLPAELRREAAAVTSAGPAAPARADRSLVVVDVTAAAVDAVRRSLALTPFEAEQRLRRGGFQLLRLASREEAAGEVARLGGEGLTAWAIPEDEVRAAPRLARGGRQEEGALRLAVDGGALRVSAGELALVVRGPITREYQAEDRGRRIRTATPAPGYRVHLWRRGEATAVELDPDSFNFSQAAPVSSQLTLLEWVESARGSAPLDDEFKREPPVLSPAPPAEGTEAMLRQARARGRQEAVILDNLEQFRFYSGWRAAVRRRLAG